MGLQLCWTIFFASIAIKNVLADVNSNEFLDLRSSEENVIIRQHLFTKINKLLSESTKLSENIEKLNARQSILELKMESIENQLLNIKIGQGKENISNTNLMTKVQELSRNLDNVYKDQNRLINQTLQGVQEHLKNLEQGQNEHMARTIQLMQNAQQYWQDLKKVQTEQSATLNQLKGIEQTHFRALEKRQTEQSDTLNQLKGNEQTHFRALEESQTDQSSTLDQLKEYEQTHFTELTKKQDEHKIVTNQLKENVEKNLKDLKERQFQNVLNLTTLLDQSSSIINPWITILRRQDGSVSFNRNWSEYKTGFGNTNGEFFIGLDKLHALTNGGAPKELLIILKDYADERRIAKYDRFIIGNEQEKYVLKSVGKYSGDAGNSLDLHVHMKFSTNDQDNDNYDSGNCAVKYIAGWWYDQCYNCNLFGEYQTKEKVNFAGIDWLEWKKDSLKFAEMKIRSSVLP